MTLKTPIFISVLIHSLIVVPLYNLTDHTRDIPKKDTIVVDYIKLKEPEPKKAMEVRTVETPKVEANKAMTVRPVKNPAPEALKAKPVDKVSKELAKKQARAKKTKEYVGYYQAIREKIRQQLKSKYKNYNREGDVHVVFTLAVDGRLLGTEIEDRLSVNDATLRNIATSSIKDAAPFPAFPKAMAVPNMSFNLIISFKNDR